MTHRLSEIDRNSPFHPREYYDWAGRMMGPGHDPEREEIGPDGKAQPRGGGESFLGPGPSVDEAVAASASVPWGGTGAQSTNAAEPSGPETAEERQARIQAQARQTLREQGITAPGGGPKRTQVLALLAQAGADIESPDLLALLNQEGMISTLLTPEGALMVRSLAARHPATGVPQYDEAAIYLGFQHGYPGTQTAAGKAQLAAFERMPALQDKPKFATHPDTGGVMYPNGVIFDPSSGQVFMPPSEAVPGSFPWLQRIQETWSDDRVAGERRRLFQLGYLSKAQAKAKGFDQTLLEALRVFHENRYKNGGRAVPIDNSSQGPRGTPIENLRQIRGQLQSEVREQFRRVFGDDPSEGEMKEWVDFIVRTGNKLQRGPGMSGPQATVEGVERFVNRLETSPQGREIRESAEENTSLHDAMLQALGAIGGLA